jgi:capsular polysaccharide transport system permease protein
LSIDHNYPKLAIDPSVFYRALEGDALDFCLDYLRREELGGPEAARLACQLGEKLYYGGRGDDAAECGRLAFAAAANDNDVVHFCAWLFSNCGCHGDAATAYERLLEQRPDWIEGYRHASGALAAAGAPDKAIDFARKASDLAPANVDFASHAGCLLLDAGRADAAETYLGRAIAIDPYHPHALRALSAAAYALDRPAEALDLARRAAAQAPEDPDLAAHAAELLLRSGRADEALALLDAAVASAPASSVLWRLRSEANSLGGAVSAALAAIDHAIERAPDNPEYHLHRAHLLYRAGDDVAAAEAIDRAAAIDPTGHATRRAQIELLLAHGQLSEATAASGELLRTFPDDHSSAEIALRVLNRRGDPIDGDDVVVPGGRARRPPHPPRRPPGFCERLKTQARVIHALIIRETRTRFGDSRLGYGWALIEPILHITLLWVMFSLLMRGAPPIGTHFFLFYFTGLIPFHLFVHTSGSMMYGVTGNVPLLQLPPVKPFDVILARGLLEFATDLAVAVVLLAGFAAVGLPALPDDLWAAATALIVTALWGCGVGYVNAVLQTLFRSWDRLWNNATRLFYFCSGIFYVPGMMPDWVRGILAWNPLLHAIDWFRAGFFAGYQPHWLDRRYLLLAALLALLTGLGLERAARHRLSEPA